MYIKIYVARKTLFGIKFLRLLVSYKSEKKKKKKKKKERKKEKRKLFLENEFKLSIAVDFKNTCTIKKEILEVRLFNTLDFYIQCIA